MRPAMIVVGLAALILVGVRRHRAGHQRRPGTDRYLEEYPGRLGHLASCRAGRSRSQRHHPVGRATVEHPQLGLPPRGVDPRLAPDQQRLGRPVRRADRSAQRRLAGGDPHLLPERHEGAGLADLRDRARPDHDPGALEVLGKKAGSDGFFWEMGAVVSATTFGADAPPAGQTDFTVRLFQVPDPD